MQVIVIDDRKQQFNGLTYYRNKHGYFIREGKPLQRVVWTFHNGDIPDGYEIHHIDGDKANNQLANLQLVTRKQHRQIHCGVCEKSIVCKTCGKEYVDTHDYKICTDCRAERKRKIELKKAEPPKPKRQPVMRECAVCGKPFEVTRNHHKRKTCSKECHDILFRAARSKKTEKPVKICVICGKEFQKQDSRIVCCSPACGAVYNGRLQRGRRTIERVISHCELCGKEIRHYPREKPRFCSRDCLNRFMSITRKRSDNYEI